MTMRVISLSDFEGYWRWRDAFAQVIDPARYTIDWLDNQVRRGLAQAWIGEDAAAVSELRHYPTGATDVHGLIAAGDMEEITGRIIPRIEKWARDNGCIGALIESREGWQKVLRDKGYIGYQRTLRKDL